MKTIIRLALIIIALSIFAHAENQEWREFTAPFKQTYDGSKILVENPNFPISEGDRLPRAGSYILNRHEILEIELRNQGYRIASKPEYFFINISSALFWFVVVIKTIRLWLE